MAKYTIECDICMGFTHYGAVETSGKDTIELSDEEVKILVDLIREKQSTDPDELGLEESHPDLYEKLDEAYSELYYQAEETHWLKDGFYNGYYEYDPEELKQYCIENCGYEFQKPPKPLPKEGEKEVDFKILIEYLRECDEDNHFSKWLHNYIDTLPYDELCDLFYNHLNADVDMDASDHDYEVHIPKEIIEMAKLTDSDNA